jgi:hypothetical protein
MPIQFPDNPSVNETHSVNGRTYIWTGQKWRRRRPRIEYVPPTMEVVNDFTAGSALKVDADTESVGIGTMTPNAGDALTVGGDTTVDGHINVYSSLTVGASAGFSGDVDVSGNLVVDGYITVPTQVAGTNDTKVATTEYVTNAIAGLVGGAPAALDTLNELAAALDNDESYAATITTALAGKLDTTHDMTLTLSGDATGTVTFTNMGNATLSVTVTDDLHNHTISNVDGLQTALDGKLSTTGKAADSNLFDGQNSVEFTRYAGSLTTQDWNTLVNGTESSYYNVVNGSGSNRPSAYMYGALVSWSTASGSKFQLYSPHNGVSGNGLWWRSGWNTDYDSWVEVWTSGTDGSGSGLDADLLDGNHASAFASSSHTHSYLPTSGGTISGSINVTSVCQSNEFQGDVGSSSDVTYMFDGDTDTGMYRYGSGEVALSGNGTWRTRTVGTGLSVNYYVNMSAGTYNHAVCGGAANAIAFRWASPYMKGSIDNVICANVANFSDARLKRNIRDWDNGIDVLRQLRPVEYTPKDIVGFGEISGNLVEGYDPKDDIIGLIAQEVREVLPSAVDGDPEGAQMLSIAEDQLMAVVISAIQDIDSRLREMESA